MTRATKKRRVSDQLSQRNQRPAVNIVDGKRERERESLKTVYDLSLFSSSPQSRKELRGFQSYE